MNLYSINFSDLTLILAALSIVVCPTLCGVMAYRISRTYTTLRNAN